MIKSVIKLSKKSLAILIALLMIISALPFTPPISVEAANADETPSETAKYVIENIGKVKKSYSYLTSNNADSSVMNGLIRTGTWTDNNDTLIKFNSSNDNNQHKIKIVGISNAVGLYTGESSDIRFPLVTQYTFENDQLAVKNYIGFDHIALNVSNTKFAMGTNTWSSCTSWDNLTSNSTSSSYDFSTDINKNVSRPTGSKDNVAAQRFKSNSEKYRYWKASVKYTGNFSDGKYYDSLKQPTFHYQADYGWTWAGSKSYQDASDYTLKLSTPLNFYVLNIKPLLDIINSSDFETNFNTIYNNLWMYDSTKREAYFTAMKNIIKFNLDDVSLTNESDVITVADKIKKLVDDYNTTKKDVPIKTITVSFCMGDGKIITKDITAGQKIGDVELPTNTSTTKINGENKHKVFSWQDGISDILPHYEEDAIFYEKATPEACTGGTATCTDAPICEECKSSYSTALGHDYGSATKIETKDEKGNILQKHQKTCSRCNDVLVENHKLTISGTTASCSDNCGYSVSSNYSSDGFRITKGNLFDVDAFAATHSNQICVDENGVEKGAVSVDTVNDTITVAGSERDAYTNYGNTTDYYGFDVEVGKYYSLSYTPSTADNQAFAFFYNSNDEHKKVTSSYSYNVIVNGEKNSSSANNDEYFANKYDAPAKSKVQIIFQAPEECTYIKFRFGTNLSGSICTFSDISFYECDENGKPVNGYEVLASDVQNGDNVLSSAGIPSKDKCKASYAMYKKSDAVGEDDPVTTNLNITFDSNHSYKNQGISVDKATVLCSKCGHHYELDYSVYKAELKTLDSMLAQTNKYSNTEACKAQRDSVKTSATASDILTQADVDAKINELKEIENNLTLQQYLITFNVASVDGTTLEPDITGTGTYEYGTMVELDLPEKYQTNYVVTTWKRNAKGVDKVVGGTSTKLYVVVNQESTYTAVINSVATDNVDENQAVVTLNNKSGKTVDVGIVDTNQEQNVTVNIADSKIKIGSVELTAPTYSFYTLKGFYIDETLYSESGGTVTITKDTVITPYYDASLFVNIDRDSDETFTINGDDKAPYTANWNQKVTLKSETEVYWYDDNNVLLGKGTTYSFYANSNVTIHTASVVSEQNVDPTASIGYFAYDSTLNKVTVVNNFFVPEGQTVEKAGVILSTKNSTVETLKAQSNGKFEGGTESFTSTGNQIRISVSRTANTKFTMYALAYVVVDGQKYFANEVKTINYTPQIA